MADHWPIVLYMGRSCFVQHSQSVSLKVPPRAHPTGSQSGSATPGQHKYRVLAPGGYSIVASEVNLSQRAGCQHNAHSHRTPKHEGLYRYGRRCGRHDPYNTGR